MWRWIALVVAAAVTVPPASAGSLADVTMPDEVTVSGATLQLNGMGLRKKLWVKVYVAGLYLGERSGDADAVIAAAGPKRVQMRFLTNKATKSKMDGAWDEGFQENSADQVAALHERVETFKGYFGDMKVGDTVEMTIVPDAGTTIRINGHDKGTIAGADFAGALLRVFIGDHPPTEELRDGLLGR